MLGTMPDDLGFDPLSVSSVAAALGHLANTGAWAPLLDGVPPPDPLAQADVELLVAFGLLSRDADGVPRLQRDEWWLRDQETAAQGSVAALRRLVHHAEGAGGGWSAEDRELVVRQGRSSAASAHLVADLVASRPALAEAFTARGRSSSTSGSASQPSPSRCADGSRARRPWASTCCPRCWPSRRRR